jgi:hypothetical protein
VVSTFLDPGFGLNAFPPEEKEAVKRKMYNLLLAAESIHESSNNSSKQTNTKNKVNNLRPTNYLSFKVKPIEERASSDKVTEILEKYLHLIDSLDVAEENLDEIKRVDALDFWRVHEHIFPGLALLAKKYLSVQASSAAVERMFSIAGHIFSVKRRRLGIKFFSQLLLLKLNENLIE